MVVLHKHEPLIRLDAAVFDFDGTLSKLRSGWEVVMEGLMCEVIPGDKDEVREFSKKYIDESTGIQTIFQMRFIAEEVEKRGGKPLDPWDYKDEYNRRLMVEVQRRRTAVSDKTEAADNYIVAGSVDFLDALKDRGVAMFAASGTDEEDVIYEAKLLGLDDAFEGGIHGAHAAMTECSKELVIRDMLEKENIKPHEMVSFGDGYVEVLLVDELGGLAIGAATEEEKRCGINEWKRNRLITAGAKAIIPDFRDAEEILKLIRG
jgi:phosphoglycolate phosphatase-like HAD superfamily hydrolase